MKKIVLLGPECSGKPPGPGTRRRYDGAYGPEYSREYAERLRRSGADIGFHDVMPIVRGQLRCEQNALQSGKERPSSTGIPWPNTCTASGTTTPSPANSPTSSARGLTIFTSCAIPTCAGSPTPHATCPPAGKTSSAFLKKKSRQAASPTTSSGETATPDRPSAENALRQSGLLP